MNMREQREAAVKAARAIVETAKAESRDLTDEEIKSFDEHEATVAECDVKIKAADESEARWRAIERMEPIAVDEPGMPELKGGPIGEAFVKSTGYQAFRKAHPSGLGPNTPVDIKGGYVGNLGDLGIGTKAATLTTTTGQFAGAQRLPGYRNELIDQGITFLDLVTTGNTTATFIEYAQIVAETDGSAIVAEGALKPLSDVTTAKADAKAFTYADGFVVTNQTLADDGALVAFMESRIRWHLRNRLEDVLLNGNGASDPKGILNTTGVQSQALVTDAITTLAAALQKIEARNTRAQAIVMNPADVWAMRLLKDTTGAYLLGNPFQQNSNPMPFGVPLVTSTRVPVKKAVVGDFSGVQLLQREPLSVMAFNQHADFAQRNQTYVRAELRALQFIYAPADIVVATIAA